MNNRYSYLLKNTWILTISNFSSKILVFLLIPLYTNVLTPEEYGLYDLVVSCTTLLFPIITLNIVDGVMRFLIDKNYNKSDIVLIGIRYILYSNIIIFLFLVCCYSFQIIQIINGYELFIFIFYLSYSIYNFLSQVAKGFEKIYIIAIASVISTTLMLTCCILFLLVFDWGIKGFIIANSLSLMVPSIYYINSLNIKMHLKSSNKNADLQKEILKYCLPLIFTTLGWWVNSTADRYIVIFFCGLSMSGILSIANKIPSVINTVFSMFGLAWQISAIKEFGTNGAKEFYSDLYIKINLIICIFGSLLILCSRYLAHILYGNEFYQACFFAPFLIIGTIFNILSGVLGPILSAQKKSKSMASSAIIGALLNVVLSTILVYCLETQGATIATALSSYVIYRLRAKAVGTEIMVNNITSVKLTWFSLITIAILDCYFNYVLIELFFVLVIFIINLKILMKLCRDLLKISFFRTINHKRL